ncbi:hypothetical protein C8R45DRAFT_943410 [Mycena sanguinolenta]|nr:hypothetical protein C8R45DRAFT_943410 [Mycena sanguinolenta]
MPSTENSCAPQVSGKGQTICIHKVDVHLGVAPIGPKPGRTGHRWVARVIDGSRGSARVPESRPVPVPAPTRTRDPPRVTPPVPITRYSTLVGTGSFVAFFIRTGSCIHRSPLLEEYNFSELTGMLYTKTLQLESQQTQDTVRRMTECLPRFTSLVYLAMDSSNLCSPLTTKDMDRPIVKGWGKACPTLEACCLNHSAWRKVDGRWKVFPVKEFRALAGLPEIRC